MATYSKEFKEEAIRLSNEIGNKKAAAQLGILETVLCIHLRKLRCFLYQKISVYYIDNYYPIQNLRIVRFSENPFPIPNNIPNDVYKTLSDP